jgi:DNA-binding GntR family transcriptional regulator
MKKQSENFSEKAHLCIKEFLLSSDIYPGQKIPHLELGKRLGISLTPLREALIRLSAEGLLTHGNQRGFSVPEIDLEEAIELYEVRALIEPYTTEIATKVAAPKHIELLHRVLNDYKEVVSEPYTRKRLLVDKKFHLEIAKLTANKILLQIFEQIYDRIILKRQILNLPPGRGQAAYHEHFEILKAMEGKDAKRASRLIKDHILNGRDFVIKDIERRQTLYSSNLLRAIR